jgi:trigger factor
MNQTEEIQSTITTIDEVTRKAAVTVPVAHFQREFEVAMKNYAGKAKINGFRAGKAPREMVEKLYGESIKWDVVSKLVSSSLDEVIKKNELQLVGSPKIDITSENPSEKLEYTADFSIYPTPKITGYEGLEISVEKEEVTDEVITKTIDSYRRSRSGSKETTRTEVQAEDIIDVSVVFKAKDGAETNSENATIGLGDGRLPKEFDEQVVGLKIGETRGVKLPAGDEGEMVYLVTLNKIMERELPELTDDFVSTLGLEPKTVLELKMDIEKNLNAQSEGQAKEKAKNVLVEKIIEINPFQVPQALIDDEVRNLLIRVGAVDPKNTKFEDIPVEPFRESFGEMAAKRVKANIVTDMIAQTEKITPNDEDMKSAFQEVAAQYRVSEAEARKMFTGRSLIHLAVEITRSKTQDMLVEKAKVTYVKKG